MSRLAEIEARLVAATLTEQHVGYRASAGTEMLDTAPQDLLFLLKELKTTRFNEPRAILLEKMIRKLKDLTHE